MDANKDLVWEEGSFQDIRVGDRIHWPMYSVESDRVYLVEAIYSSDHTEQRRLYDFTNIATGRQFHRSPYPNSATIIIERTPMSDEEIDVAKRALRRMVTA